MRENEMYNKLYSIVKENYKKNGMDMLYTQEAFLQICNTNSEIIDISKLSKLDKMSFFEAAFILLLERFPDEGAYEAWKKNLYMDDYVFKKRLINSVINSEEFKRKNVKISHNIYK